MPFVNSHIHYLGPADIINNVFAFQEWYNITNQPTTIVTSIPGYMLLQAGSFILMRYDDTPDRQFIFKSSISVDIIFPIYERTSLIAVTGNSSVYIFLGVKTLIESGTHQLIFKTYNPVTGTITILTPNPTYTFDLLRSQVTGFIYSDTDAWFLTSVNRGNSSSVVLQGDVQYSPTSTQIKYIYAGDSSSSLQGSPRSKYFYFSKTFPIITIYKFSVDSTDSNYIRNSSFAGNIINLLTTGKKANYTQFAITVNKLGVDDILLIAKDSYNMYKFFKIERIDGINAIVDESQQLLHQVPRLLFGGPNGSWWILNDSFPFILGNTNNTTDNSIDTAWQIFFPTMKIEFREITEGVKPMLDLNKLKYPEWPHTAMFAYSNHDSLLADIGGQWGLESNTNFMVSDVSFNGFYFNSYIQNIPLENSPDTDYYLAIRGWLPTESFQTLVRFTLPKAYDFGYIKLMDIANEWIMIQTSHSNFTQGYYNALSQFGSYYVFRNLNFGANFIQGFSGSNLTSSNFGDFLYQYSTLYATYLLNTNTLQNIQSAVTSSLQKFISNDLQYILPPTAITRQRYTDPINFDILWYSNLQPSFQTLVDQWGLGWNLGYAKTDLSNATIYTAPNIFKIQQGYIYLQLNPEFNINRIDAGSKEDYSTSKEPTGKTNNYYCKLLLTDFGGNATTFFHNPVTFNPPLGKLSRLNFQWLDDAGNQLNNMDSDWNMVINISEGINTQTKFDR